MVRYSNELDLTHKYTSLSIWQRLFTFYARWNTVFGKTHFKIILLFSEMIQLLNGLVNFAIVTVKLQIHVLRSPRLLCKVRMLYVAWYFSKKSNITE